MDAGSGFTPVGALNEGLWIEGCSAVVAEASQVIFFRQKPPCVTHYNYSCGVGGSVFRV